MGRVVRAVGGAITAPFKAAASVVKGVVRGAGQVLKGAGQVLTGDFKGGLHSMFVKSGGEVLSGALGGAKHILGNPITATIAGGLLGGPVGAFAGLAFGGAASNYLGNMQQGVISATGIGPQQAFHQANNYQAFGPYNGSYGAGGGQIMPPYLSPNMYPYNPNPGMYPPQFGPQYGPPQFGPQPWGPQPFGGGGMDPMMRMMMMSQMVGCMSQMMGMMSMMGGCGFPGSNPYGGQVPFPAPFPPMGGGCCPGGGFRFC